MTDRKALSDQTNNTPEDVATLYTWANLHGAKYRDFSASRAQSREKARQRVQEAIEEERRRVSEQAKAEEAAEAQRAVDSVHAAEAERLAEIAAQTAARLSELTATYAKPPNSPQPAAPVQQRGNPGFAPPENDQPAFLHPHSTPVTEDSFFQPSDPWTSPESQDNPGSLAWFVPGHCETGGQPLAHVQPRQASEDALLEPSHRLTPRWFALKSVFEGTFPPVETAKALAPASSRAPVLAVFSLAGGVGKTSLVATLGRALSARGEKVLLVDTAAYGLLPLFFGARDQRPGVLRTFTPPGASGEAPIQMVTIDPEFLGSETASSDAAGQNSLASEIARFSRSGVSRVIVDLATASGATTRRIMRMAPLVLVPVVPDMNSVVSVGAIDAFFQHSGAAAGNNPLPYYMLNRFDASLPLHLDVREVLRARLGDRLLPFAIRRAPAVSEALAEGMTVIDYAPNSAITEDFGNLAGWVKSISAPGNSSYRGVRWSER